MYIYIEFIINIDYIINIYYIHYIKHNKILLYFYIFIPIACVSSSILLII